VVRRPQKIADLAYAAAAAAISALTRATRRYEQADSGALIGIKAGLRLSR